jgi:hypothetical protein
MVGVVQLVERQVVILNVAGSSPVTHPNREHRSTCTFVVGAVFVSGPMEQLFREEGINRTGMDQLCAVAQVSKRTAYQHFGGKDELIAEYPGRGYPHMVLATTSMIAGLTADAGALCALSAGRCGRPRTRITPWRCRRATAPTVCSSHRALRFPTAAGPRCGQLARCRRAWCGRRTIAHCWD